MECIRAIWGDADFADDLIYEPERHYADEDQTVRLYHDMHTGKWWWRTQVCSSHVRLVDLRELMHEPVHSERLKTPRNQRTVPLFPSSSRPTKRSLHNSATRPPTLCTSRLAIFPNTSDASRLAKVKSFLPICPPPSSATLQTRHRGAAVCPICSTAAWRIFSGLSNRLGRWAWIWSAGMEPCGDASPYMLFLWGDYPEQLLVTLIKNGEYIHLSNS